MAPSLSGNTLNLKFMQRAAAKKAAAAGAGAEGSSQAPNHQRGDRGGSRDRQQTQAASGVAQQNVSSSSGSSSYLATASSSLSSAAGQGNSSGFRGPSITVESSYLAFPILSSIYGGQGGLGAAAAPASGRLSFGKQKADNEGRHSKSHKAKQKQKADRDDEGEPDLDMSDVDDNDSGSGSSEGDAESSKQPTANGKKGGKLRFKQQQQKHKNEAQQTLQAPRPPPGHRKFWKPAGFEEASQPSRSIRDAKRQENIKTYGLETTGQDQAACDVTGGGDEDGLLASDDDDRGSDGSDFVGDMIAQARLKRKAGLPAGDLAGGSIVREDARETKRKRHRKPKQD